MPLILPVVRNTPETGFFSDKGISKGHIYWLLVQCNAPGSGFAVKPYP